MRPKKPNFRPHRLERPALRLKRANLRSEQDDIRLER